jgi:hypothetical protein
MILPVDYGCKLGNDTVKGIPDRTLGWFLDKLAEKKGNNIVRKCSCLNFYTLTIEQVVIFDCCHSGSGARDDVIDPRRIVRGADVDAVNTIPADLDLNIWVKSESGRGTIYEPGFLRKGLWSHVFLAACSANGKAFEDKENKRGEFTHALFSLLKTTSDDSLTYAELLDRIKPIKRQFFTCYMRPTFFIVFV